MNFHFGDENRSGEMAIAWSRRRQQLLQQTQTKKKALSLALVVHSARH
jgi:hypothetical protein